MIAFLLFFGVAVVITVVGKATVYVVDHWQDFKRS